MYSLGDLERDLATVLGSIADAAGHITTAQDLWEDRGGTLNQCLYETQDPDALEVLKAQSETDGELVRAQRLLRTCRDTIEQYRQRLHHSDTPPLGPTLQPSKMPNPTGPDGSEYPPKAQWAIDEALPARVERYSKTPTVGYVRINDLPVRVQSGDDPFSDMVRERLRQIGVRRSGTLPRHVELKVAAMLLRSQNTYG